MHIISGNDRVRIGKQREDLSALLDSMPAEERTSAIREGAVLYDCCTNNKC